MLYEEKLSNLFDWNFFFNHTDTDDSRKRICGLMKGFSVNSSAASLQALLINAYYKVPVAMFHANRNYIYERIDWPVDLSSMRTIH